MSSLNRRLMLGTALAAFAAPFGAAMPASAQQAGAVGACPLCQRLGAPFGVNAGAKGSYVKVARSSGDAETDRFLGVALGRLAETFHVSPGFAFYDDSASPNAVAVRETLVGNGPGSVLMGMHLFGQLMARVRDGGITVISVCAHEFGHIYQMQAGYEEKLGELDRTNRPFELHADFLAGYYLALRKAEHRELDLSAVGGVLHALGDTAFNSREHHGTPQERVAALAAGFKFGTEGRHDVSEAAKAGFLLIRRNS
ncbi:MAG: hypothetical protein JOY64_27840 [Alphaproteobacteria bacterium]|nr:hypothetical protein [Alphaproteobacteria bacterium]MBV8411471.1 hypothetical protein [Alphaproteobacteria bacterium]